MFQFKQSAGMFAIHALMLLGAATAWAGRGDIDPNFGIGGRLELPGELSLVLPDDRLVLATYAGNLVVARLDANGKVDPSFGEGGETRVPLPSPWPRFEPSFVGVAPDGGLVFAGPLRDYELDTFQEAVLRLDRDGRVVTSFGGHGDGYYRLTDAPVDSFGLLHTSLAAIAVDATGRILLAEHAWMADGNCSGPTGLTRLTSTGTPDGTFGANGSVEVSGVVSCESPVMFGVRNDGSIVLGARGAIVGLDANGTLDPTFGTGGHVSHEFADDFGRTVLLPDGRILIVERLSSATGFTVVLSKLDRGGQLDTTFGNGTAAVQLEFGAAFLGLAGSNQSVDEFVLAPDAAQVYLKVSVERGGGTACSGGIARFSLDGTPDLDFGRQGLTCLDYGSLSFSLIAAQRNGSPLFGTQYGLYRLLMDTTPSPGLITIAMERIRRFGEGDGIATVPVVRTAGRDGAVSVSFATGPRSIRYQCGYHYCVTAAATPGSDFEAVSGQLDWADGEESERQITVRILDDEIGESPNEAFGIQLSNPEGGVLDPGPSVAIGILDDDEAVSQVPPPIDPPVSPSTGGGGGSLTWATLLVGSVLLLGRQRRKRVLVDNLAIPVIAIHALMLLGAATACAGRGDVDPNYGEDGRLATDGPSVRLALPGDRLVIADGGTGEGFRVRMVDATGRRRAPRWRCHHRTWSNDRRDRCGRRPRRDIRRGWPPGCHRARWGEGLAVARRWPADRRFGHSHRIE